MTPPLAHTARPTSLTEVVGQKHLIALGKPLHTFITTKQLPLSIIFWGPPGSGKTTLARIIARSVEAECIELSAVNTGKADIERAVNRARLTQRKTILFLDEIHRFNKAQQDALLPHVESGTLTLIGATTENPSFEVNNALLSRSHVFILNRLTDKDLEQLLTLTLTKLKKTVPQTCITQIAHYANGDARQALGILELLFTLSPSPTEATLTEALQKKHLHYDKNGEEHHNCISALHKSMRDSDPQGAAYWIMRMIEGGEKPEYLVRRMIRFASEDIGLADPRALEQATATLHAVNLLGYPECNTALVQCAIYLSLAPKSNAVYQAVLTIKELIQKTGNLPVPFHLRNAPTTFMKQIGYGKDYQYAHNAPDAQVNQQHLPSELTDTTYYTPQRGWEIEQEEAKKSK
ncbi:replication-associated recombination protein A [Candidatus Pacearchaeota archaeon]|nr:replication-associated recombination protein A [Candidatus Pacearchaeota archaeon]